MVFPRYLKKASHSEKVNSAVRLGYVKTGSAMTM
jgi:hypothetical protein